MKINDDEWFELQFRPEEAFKKYGVKLPALPSDEIQIGFTGSSGLFNMRQAFSFYKYVCSVCQISNIREPLILDFGGGWGRISRFFLRDTKPESIFIAETREYAIDCLRKYAAGCSIIHNQPRPPIPGLPGQLDLACAYSVFSHLSEEYFQAWVNYLLSVLRPGGYLVFTTRGQFFINHLEHLHSKTEKPHEVLEEYVRRMLEELPSPEEIRRHYLNGEFQFYPIGGAGECTADFFGETFIPKRYIEQNFGPFFVDLTDDVQYVDQSVVVLRKPA